MKNSPIDMDYQLIYIFNDVKKIRIWFRSNLVVSVLHCVYFIKRWENDLVNKLKIRSVFSLQFSHKFSDSMIMCKVISTMCIEFVYIERALQYTITCSFIHKPILFVWVYIIFSALVFVIVLLFFSFFLKKIFEELW